MKMKRVVFLLCCVFLAIAAFAQTRIESNNLMAPKEHNYTSFEQAPQKNANNELASRTSSKYKNHPEYDVLPYNIQCKDCYEVIEERTAFTRHYLKNGSNGKIFYNQAGANPINYQDEGGNWRAIDPRLFPSDKANVFVAYNQPSPTRIDLSKNEVAVVNGNNTLSFNRNLKLYHQTDDGTKLIANADWSQATAGSDGARVKNIFPGITLEVYVINGGLKTNFIVNSKLSYTEGYLLIEDEMKLPAGTSISTGLATKKDLGFDGMITINDLITGNALYEIGAAVGYDNSDHRLIPTEKFLYRVKGNNLTIAVPVKWMNTPGLTYPLIIDPLVSSTNTMLQGSIAGSGGNGSGAFNPATACPYILVVPTPANSTITDVRFAFDYVAQNGAVKSEGATDFLYNGCRSPINATFYWFCNQATPGACTTGVGGLSIFTDIQSCIPAPSCTPYNMSFTMRFYDRFGGACSNTFIAANSNWTMTVEGRTSEFTNPGTPFTVSAGTICAGQSILATFNGVSFGVPAHTINWSLNPSGTPSVGTGSNPTINFATAGTYTLYCIVTDQCNVQQTASTVVTVNPAPSITITPTANPICLGQSTTLNAGTATTYTWSANAGGGNGSSANVTPGVGATVYTVSGTASGCSSSATTTITVNPLPSVTATANPTSVCSGQSAALTAGGATTYTWSPNEGGTSNNPTSVSPTSTDTYTVTGTDANGCVNTAQVTVNVTPSPIITVNPTAASICAGSVVTCTVSGATTYTWMPGSITTNTISVNPASTTTYVVTGDNSGCTGTNTFVVTVNPLPSLTVTATPANVCTGQTSTLTASGATSYTWSANAGGVTASTTTVSPSSSTTYTVTGDLAGCLDSTTITVNMGAAPVLSISASDTTICNGQATTLTASGATNYTWSPGGPGAVITQSPTGTTTYTLIGDNSGCADTINFVVNVNPTPTVSAVSSPTAICSGQSSTLTASGAITYTWSANAGSVQTNTASVSPTNTSTYTVNGTDNNGCSGSAQVTVSVTATPTIIAIAASPTVCSGQSTGLVANGTATSYSWSANAGGGTSQFANVTPTITDTYTVTGFNGSCSSFTTVTVAVVTQPTVTVAGAPTALCSGQSATLTATFNPSNSTVNWSGGLGSNDTVVVTPTGTNTYTFTATNGACTDAQSITITVNPTPTMAPVSGQTVCSGNNVNAINFAPVNGTVNWTNTNTNIGLAASGSGSTIAGYQAPSVTAQQVGVITATPTNTTSGCTGVSQTFTIVINALPVITPGISDSAFCGMPTGGVSGISATGSAPLTYSWSNGSTSPNLSNVPVGNYTLTVTDVNGCKAGATTGYAVGGTPAVIAAFTPSTNSGQATLNVNFTNNSVNGVNFNWNFGNGALSTSTNSVVAASYTNGGDYIVTLIATAGTCTSIATDTIRVEQPIKIEFPNVFSPNGDNINEDFSFIVSGITELTCEIFNRWGQKVITMTGPTSKWGGQLDNGNAASEGTYFYTVIAKSYDGKMHNKQGTVTLVR